MRCTANHHAAAQSRIHVHLLDSRRHLFTPCLRVNLGLHLFQPARITLHQPASHLTPLIQAACPALLPPIITFPSPFPTLGPLEPQIAEIAEQLTGGRATNQQWVALDWTTCLWLHPQRTVGAK
ncbi:hypothetical protein AB205_0050850 [Aquarana catesbeiana]|uniref:Uncharacterized protein n=1 Tax=Aquarana catesbeiana TaxID=8400 RepID=A0A2G9RSE2_AQUCT|nr:hypothetical protein AB205_0050850 [Aquarana catesbeiana]